MDWKQINELRLTGKVQEAFEAAIEALAASPDDVSLRNELAMCLVVKMGRTATYAQRAEFFAYLNEVAELQVPAMGVECANQKVVNPILKFIIDCSHHNKALEVADGLFEIVRRLDFVRPSGAYSRLLSIFAGLKNVHLQPWQGFVKFFEWWDSGNLRPADFEVHLTSNYDSYRDGARLSLAEQAYVMQSKAMLRELPKGGYTRQQVLGFVINLITLAQEQKGFVYPTYYAARLLHEIDMKAEAVDSLKDFIARSASTKMWVWSLLGDYLQDVNLRYAAYCKAVTCQGPDNMRLALYEKLGAIYEHRGDYNHAKAEYEAAMELRRRHEWASSPEISYKLNLDWWSAATSATDMRQVHLSDSKRIERYVFGKDTIAIVVTEVSPEAQYLSYISDKQEFGKLQYGGFIDHLPKVGDIYRCRISLKEATKSYIIRSMHIETSHLARIPFIKRFRGRLKWKDGNDYAFVGRNYVRYEFLQGRKPGEPVRGYARPEFSLSYKKVSWNVFVVLGENDPDLDRKQVEELWRQFPVPQDVVDQSKRLQAVRENLQKQPE